MAMNATSNPAESRMRKLKVTLLFVGGLALICMLTIPLALKRIPPPMVTISVIGSTGHQWYKPPQPIWRFAITNSGKSPVTWHSGVIMQGAIDRDFNNAGGHIEWPEGRLLPGQGIETNMIVPAVNGAVWQPFVWYSREPTALELKASRWRKWIPNFDSLFDYRREYSATNEWNHNPP